MYLPLTLTLTLTLTRYTATASTFVDDMAPLLDTAHTLARGIFAQAPLRAYHATLKFAAVKALVFVTPIQRALLNAVFGRAGPWWLHLA